jgi:hypothetical protein
MECAGYKPFCYGMCWVQAILLWNVLGTSHSVMECDGYLRGLTQKGKGTSEGDGEPAPTLVHSHEVLLVTVFVFKPRNVIIWTQKTLMYSYGVHSHLMLSQVLKF